MIYNDTNPAACAWLRRLVDAGALPPGRVHEGGFELSRPAPGETAHLFAGVGGWPLALKLAGWPPERQVWTASLPCQPFSNAGAKRGFNDERHLWPAFARMLEEHRPPVLFGEQVASPDGREWLAAVRADLEDLGYAVGAADLCAASVGAPHNRPRLFWVALADGERCEVGPQAGLHGQGEPGPDDPRRRAAGARGGCRGGDADRAQRAGGDGPWGRVEWRACQDGVRRPVEPGVEPVVDGLPRELVTPWADEVRGYGNAIVPALAAEFIQAVMEC